MRRVLPLLLLMMCTTLGAAERRVAWVFANDGGYVIEPIASEGRGRGAPGDELRSSARAFLRNHHVKSTEELEVNARVMDAGDELLIVGSWSTPEVACAGSLS